MLSTLTNFDMFDLSYSQAYSNCMS